MCEGSNEKAVIDLLIDDNKLFISRKNLLNREVFVCRQICKTPSVVNALRIYDSEVFIFRIGDKLNDEFVIPKEFQNKINKVNIKKLCTKPEIEMLLIINQKKVKEYEKCKSNLSPKVFAKINIKMNKRKYDCRTDFWSIYYKDRVNELVDDIKYQKKYKKNTKIKDEEYLADLLK